MSFSEESDAWVQFTWKKGALSTPPSSGVASVNAVQSMQACGLRMNLNVYLFAHASILFYR